MKTRFALATIGLGLSLLTPAVAGDNDNYGVVTWNSLPLSGQVSKSLWVGSWWAYTRDGIAYRHRGPDAGRDYAKSWTRWDNRDVSALSAVEKLDHLMGRADRIEYDKLIEKGRKYGELQGAMKSKIDERRNLVRRINRAISENGSGYTWWTSPDGERYNELKTEIDELGAGVDEIALTIDTATEWEIFSHGSMQWGVQNWFGHCNAWAAAAIMEPEPRRDVTVDGITFTAGEVKALLTEAWMEQHSSFYGTRNEDHETEEGRDDVSFRDVTPAAFHILFADLIGRRDQSFVIDRFTGSEVWNQSASAYRSKVEALYTGTTGLEREVTYTRYGAGGATEDNRGTMTVFPILVTTTIHWVTDGLPHETLTVPLSADIDDETFASARDIRELYHDQIEIRTLTYELWLDKPMDDPDARIIGDGVWQFGASSGYEHLNPDFIWQPLANVNNARDYENPFLDYRVLVDRILPGSLEPADDPAVPGTLFSSVATQAIPDADPAGASVTIEVDSDIDISTMTAAVDISHSYIGDLQVTLTSPSGKSEVLKEFRSGGSAANIKKTYDVKAFNNTAARGTWTLSVVDNWQRDTGTINKVELSIK